MVLKRKIIFFIFFAIFIFWTKQKISSRPKMVKRNNDIPQSILTYKKTNQNQINLNAANNDCEKLLNEYLFLDNINNANFKYVFKNIHYSIGGKFYRLREFTKNDPIQTKKYLVLIEDSDENTSIIENSTEYPGPFFLKIQKNIQHIIFREDGINYNNYFLFYKDKQLKLIKELTNNSPKECQY